MAARISLIIPTLNEAGIIVESLKALPPNEEAERIVVDGGSSDDTAALARALADRVLITEPGRARQMNAGARVAQGEIFLFLHADTRLPAEAFEAIFDAVRDPAVAGGAFALAIDSPRPGLRLVARAANWRTRLTGVPYGDQGLFVRRSVFERLGGFPDLPIMEDLEFSRRLKKSGKIVLLKSPIATSPRRWDREGAGTVTLRNQIFVLLYWLGVSPARLARWYRPIR